MLNIQAFCVCNCSFTKNPKQDGGDSVRMSRCADAHILEAISCQCAYWWMRNKEAYHTLIILNECKSMHTRRVSLSHWIQLHLFLTARKKLPSLKKILYEISSTPQTTDTFFLLINSISTLLTCQSLTEFICCMYLPDHTHHEHFPPFIKDLQPHLASPPSLPSFLQVSFFFPSPAFFTAKKLYLVLVKYSCLSQSAGTMNHTSEKLGEWEREKGRGGEGSEGMG